VGIPWLPGGYSAFVLDYGHSGHHAHFNFLLASASTVMAIGGILLAYFMYLKKSISPQTIAEKFKALYNYLAHKWYWDDIYNALVINPALKFADYLALFDKYVIDGLVNFMGKFTLVISWIHQLFDKYIVDGAVNGLGYTIRGIGWLFSRFQTGRIYNYALVIVFGVVLILIIKLF